MADRIDCPRCARQLQLTDEYIGKQVQCPACGNVFVANPKVNPAGPTDSGLPKLSAALQSDLPGHRFDEAQHFGREEDGVDAEALEEEAAAWQKVRTGFGLIVAAILILAGTVLIVVCGGIAIVGAAAQPGGGRPVLDAQAAANMRMLVGFALVASLTYIVLQIAGLAFCVAAPARNGSRNLAVTALVLALMSGLISFLAGFLDGVDGAANNPLGGLLGQNGGGRAISPISSLGNLIGFVGFVVFLFFQRSVALRVRSQALLKTVNSLIVLGGLTMAGLISITVMNVMAGPGGLEGLIQRGQLGAFAAAGTLCSCSTGLLALGFIIWYIVSLFQTREALARFINR